MGRRVMLASATLATALAFGASAASASANVYCVGTGGPECTTTTFSLGSALTGAEDGDTVRIGPGSYSSSVGNSHAITVVGSGSSGAAAGGTTVTAGGLSKENVLELTG